MRNRLTILVWTTMVIMRILESPSFSLLSYITSPFLDFAFISGPSLEYFGFILPRSHQFGCDIRIIIIIVIIIIIIVIIIIIIIIIIIT